MPCCFSGMYSKLRNPFPANGWVDGGGYPRSHPACWYNRLDARCSLLHSHSPVFPLPQMSNFSSNNSIFRTMPGQKANHMIVCFTKSYGKKRVFFKNVRRYHWLKYCAWVPVFLPLRTRSTPMMGNFFWRDSDGREAAFVGISACARYEERF